MQNLKKRLISYIEAISGEHLDLVPEKTLALPLFLRERYSVLSTRLFGQRFLLAVEKEDWETGSPAEYGKHAEALALTLRDRVVLVLPLVPSFARNRMVQMGVPFIIPGR